MQDVLGKFPAFSPQIRSQRFAFSPESTEAVIMSQDFRPGKLFKGSNLNSKTPSRKTSSKNVDESSIGEVSFESKSCEDHNYDQVGIRTDQSPYHLEVKEVLTEHLRKTNSMHNTVSKILQSRNTLAINAVSWLRGQVRREAILVIGYGVFILLSCETK